ncbi:MAG TPA: enoyl-CoA hydratase [Hyphomonadaceae bacterium]|nr:enoyl-CoA hydratase [Hyphomonadaceae bacterium]
MADTQAAAAAYTDITTRNDNGVFVITLNRPDKLNAWRGEMDRDVRAAMRAASTDDSVRVIVLTGAGKGFCAGADMGLLQTIQSGDAKAGRSVVNAHQPWDPQANPNFQKQYSWFPAVPKPIIAAINGAAAGLGLIIALYCDIRFASDAAKFTTAFSRRGLVAEHGISWLLPRITGFAHAADLLYSARVITAQEALQMGLVSRVIPAATFEADVMAYARMLATEVSPRSLREMKREIWNAQFQPLGEAIDAANADMPPSFQSEDFKEGIAHFVEKRAPRFTGR